MKSWRDSWRCWGCTGTAWSAWIRGRPSATFTSPGQTMASRAFITIMRNTMDNGPAAAAEADGVPEPEPGLRMSLEAVLLVADEPVPQELLAEVTQQPAAAVAAALRELAHSYAAEQRGFDLREVAGGWRLYTRPECAAVVERFVS